ncbi:glycosyl transferase [Acrocarpospora corrugata]|uniref:Glycosyl transferase n=1 Tax=Acrocarpospora corrugata TaxID=35763 RepID=A0A5M3W385_9ACTN|nr:glycosyltransferase [Acrocarpospora corrugata]GES01601.1 glycosyl transferase [Acrocarpospora corrugata]
MTPSLSIVIPTFNESGNIAPLLAEIDDTIDARTAVEIIFVDDSTDDTPEVISRQSAGRRGSVSLIHRAAATGGLAGAVADGLRVARGSWVVVMDGDLQHPPSVIPTLIAEGERTGAHLVVASRYIPGGDHGGLAGRHRVLASRLSTLAAKVLFRRLYRVSDPMSGYFAVRRTALRTDRLRPVGYKVLLEVIVRCQIRRISEVPYGFRERATGDSKSSVREGVRFLRHLARLRISTGSATLARPGEA